MFKFKQFSVKQELTAMKVGTDGVLLGAWTPLDSPKNILDIGAGTGLLSLMLAQRTQAQIHAIEIDNEAFTECKENFLNSKWADRLSVFNLDIKEYFPDIQYDMIISNPPFFTENIISTDEKRKLARFTQSLSFEELLEKVSQLLAKQGHFSVIIPYKEEAEFIKKATQKALFPQKITRVKGNYQSEIKRSLLLFSFEKTLQVVENELVIEIERHNYTTEYKKLTQEYYLKF